MAYGKVNITSKKIKNKKNVVIKRRVACFVVEQNKVKNREQVL